MVNSILKTDVGTTVTVLKDGEITGEYKVKMKQNPLREGTLMYGIGDGYSRYGSSFSADKAYSSTRLVSQWGRSPLIALPFVSISEKENTSYDRVLEMVTPYFDGTAKSDTYTVKELYFEEDTETSVAIIEVITDIPARNVESYRATVAGIGVLEGYEQRAITSASNALKRPIWYGYLTDDEGNLATVQLRGYETIRITTTLEIRRKHEVRDFYFEVRGQKYGYRLRTFHSESKKIVDKSLVDRPNGTYYRAICGNRDYYSNIYTSGASVSSFIYSDVFNNSANKEQNLKILTKLCEILDNHPKDKELSVTEVCREIVASEWYEKDALRQLTSGNRTNTVNNAPTESNNFTFLFRGTYGDDLHRLMSSSDSYFESREPDVLGHVAGCLFPWAMYPIISEDTPEPYTKDPDDITSFGHFLEIKDA